MPVFPRIAKVRDCNEDARSPVFAAGRNEKQQAHKPVVHREGAIAMKMRKDHHIVVLDRDQRATLVFAIGEIAKLATVQDNAKVTGDRFGQVIGSVD